MGRQPYLIRLALGRSPYEPPDSINVSQSHAPSNRPVSHSADDYVQQYDERGHPVFPESKALARDLRRAKNDVLSTMGVVVSGEAGRSGFLSAKKSVGDITAENDYGLVIVAFDHVLHFFGSWSAGSLGRRIQTFQSYTHAPLIRLVRSECQRIGWSAELFAGMPLWAARVTLPICRTQLLDPFLTYIQNKLTSYLDASYARLAQNGLSIIRSSARVISFIFFQQIHMFCILQTLHLIPHSALLRPTFLVPFSKFSLIQSPALPSDISLNSLGRFASDVACTPFAFAFIYVLVRPIVEDRIYRMIRRHLPKQERPDEVSIQVAMDNDLLEWTLPTAGRRTEDEVRRSNLTLFEDMKEEIREFRKWVARWLGYNHDEISEDKISVGFSDGAMEANPENVFADIADEDNAHQSSNGPNIATSSALLQAPMMPTQALTNGQFVTSPDEITPNASNAGPPTERMEPGEMFPPNTSGDSWLPFQDYDQDPRSNTLISRPVSPESPLTSPRIRASLTHQNSFTTTMELSLQSSRTPNNQDTLDPVAEVDTGHMTLSEWPTPLDGTGFIASELIPNQVNQSIIDEALAESAMVTDAGQLNLRSSTETDVLWDVLNGNARVSDLVQPTVLPHVVEEPVHSPTHHPNIDQLSEAGTEELARRQSHSLPPWRSSSQSRSSPHKQRVTVLSSYPADALAHHLASLISGFLFIPFESFFYRSLARAYLTSPLATLYGSTSFVPLSDIRGLNAFAGGGGRRDMAAYMGKLAMIFGIQVGVSGFILGVSSATAVGIGKRLFDWGKL